MSNVTHIELAAQAPPGKRKRRISRARLTEYIRAEIDRRDPAAIALALRTRHPDIAWPRNLAQRAEQSLLIRRLLDLNCSPADISSEVAHRFGH
jgi:hypothetical protein